MPGIKLDILAFGAHPDDVEMSCGGTVMSHIKAGSKVGIVDLTKGDLGTRGSAELRLKEAAAAAKIMGVTVRENLSMSDGFFRNDEEHQIKVIQVLRKYKPKVVLANAVTDRHPDHGRAAQLVSDACFLSGLIKIETQLEGKKQEAWRPTEVYHYIQDKEIQPDFLVDVSAFFDRKMDSIKAYRSQFFDPNSNEPLTYISQPDFLDSLRGRHRNWGKIIGVSYAEAFTVERIMGVKNLMDLL